MALQGMRPGWDAAAAAALASRLVGGVGLPAVLRAGGDAGSEGGRAVLVRSLHASMRSSCPSCPLLAHSRPRSSRTYGRILSPPRSSAPSTVWRAAVRWLEKWPQNKKNNIVLCVPPSQVWRPPTATATATATTQWGLIMPWSGRRRLLVAGPEQALAAFRAELTAVRPAYLAELRLEVAIESSAQCSTQLFGLDGGCKLEQPKVLPLRDIFSAIESMPMWLAEVWRSR
jgi:hypothetical protein